jgi:hypothetical protein
MTSPARRILAVCGSLRAKSSNLPRVGPPRMQRRPVSMTSCAVAMSLNASGCGLVEANCHVPADRAGSGGVGSGAASGLAGAPSEVEYSGECTVETVPSTCAEDWFVTSDVLVRCDVEDFGITGVRVAPVTDAGGVYVVATDRYEHFWFMTLGADGQGNFRELPAAFAGNTSELTLSPEGMPSLAVDERRRMAADWDHRVTVLDPLADAALEEVIGPGTVSTFEYDAAGTLHLGYLTEEGDLSTLTRNAGGAFVASATWPFDPSDWWLHTADGQWLVLRRIEEDLEYTVTVDTGSETYALGSFPAFEFPRLSRVPFPLPHGDDVPPKGFVLGVDRDGKWSVLQSRPGQVLRLDLDLPPAPRSSCIVEDHSHCPEESCEEVTDGVLPESVAFAQTSNGRLWAAWVHSKIDQSQTWGDSCVSLPNGCLCPIDVTRDATRGEVVVAELFLEQGRLREVLRLDSKDIVLAGGSGDRPLDLRAFGRDLALGVRVRWADSDDPRVALRVVRLDTNGL